VVLELHGYVLPCLWGSALLQAGMRGQWVCDWLVRTSGSGWAVGGLAIAACLRGRSGTSGVVEGTGLIAVIFEVWPAEGQTDTYLDIAAALRPELETIDGFLSIERFSSLSEPGKVLSLSFWRDDASVARWRTRENHRAAQVRGRGGVFANYRLRVADVLRDYGMAERDEAPADSRAVLESGSG